jgi:hypothetical protein
VRAAVRAAIVSAMRAMSADRVMSAVTESARPPADSIDPTVSASGTPDPRSAESRTGKTSSRYGVAV